MPKIGSLTLSEFEPELLSLLNADQKTERELRPTSTGGQRSGHGSRTYCWRAAQRLDGSAVCLWLALIRTRGQPQE